MVFMDKPFDDLFQDKALMVEFVHLTTLNLVYDLLNHRLVQLDLLLYVRF